MNTTFHFKEVFDFYKGKKVLVTGHTGFKGTWLSRILVNAGAEVTGYSLNPPTEPALFSMAGLEGKMTSVIGDIRDLAHLKETFEVKDDIETPFEYNLKYHRDSKENFEQRINWIKEILENNND